MSQSPSGDTPTGADLRAYTALVSECTGAAGLSTAQRVTGVVSATPRSTTLRVELDDGPQTYAFKFVEAPAEPSAKGDGPDVAYLRAVVENEAAVLAGLREHTRDLLVASCATERRSWVMTRWLPGPSASQEARALRTRLQGPDEADVRAAQCALLALIGDAFDTVSALHGAGYTHGDLQPMHLLQDEKPGGGGPPLALIDFGLARRVRGAPRIPYRGALAHFAAPEVAAAMAVGSRDINYDPLCEVYSAASVAFVLYAGKTTTDYGGGDDPKSVPFLEQLARIADPNGASRRSFASAGAPPFPELEAVLERCLAPERSARCPSLADAAADLRRLRSAAEDVVSGVGQVFCHGPANLGA